MGDDISSRDDEIVSCKLPYWCFSPDVGLNFLDKRMGAPCLKSETWGTHPFIQEVRTQNHTLAPLSPKAGPELFSTCRSRKYIVSSI